MTARFFPFAAFFRFVSIAVLKPVRLRLSAPPARHRPESPLSKPPVSEPCAGGHIGANGYTSGRAAHLQIFTREEVNADGK